MISLVAPHAASAAQPNNNFIELAHIDTYAQYNDCWGYRDPNTGVEYALLGTTTGTSIWNISDPFNPYETGFVAGSMSGWRDIDTYGARAYATTEGTGGGLQVIDISNPEAPFLAGTRGTFTAHTLWIDQQSGIAYCNGVGLMNAQGFRSFNLAADPINPPLVSNWGVRYYHDVYSRNGKLYGSAIFNGGHVDILRVTNPPTVGVMGIFTYASGFTHNSWPTDDGQHLFTTDELLGTGTVRVWDVSDTSSVLQVNQFPVWTNTCVHNVYVKNDTAWCSWYEEGVLVFDVTDPLNEVQIGSFDTGPDTTSPFGNYAGCWAVYPFLPSGVIISSDIGQGMHLTFFTEEIGTVSGTVTDAVSGNPIAGVEVAIPDFFNRRVMTDALGSYSAVLPGGLHPVIASKTPYTPDTSSVAITDGAVTDHDIVLSSPVTGVGANAPVDGVLALDAPVPNPTRGATALSLSLPRAADASLVIFDAAGRRVRTIVSGQLGAGRHALSWDGRDDSGRDVASGAFFARLASGGEVRSRRILLAR